MGRLVIKGTFPFNDDDHKGLSLIVCQPFCDIDMRQRKE